MNRGLLGLAVAALALSLAGSAATRPPVAAAPSVELVALLDGAPLAERPHAAAADRPAAGRGRGADPGHRPGRADSLALPAGAERAGGRRAGRLGLPDRRHSRRARDTAERPLPPLALPEPPADRRAAGLGADPGHRGPRDEDRDHRRRRRPDASVLLAGRLLDARRLPEGQHRLHHGQGDRRACVPAARGDLALRERAVRSPAVGARHARGRDRRRRPRHDRAGTGRQGAGLRDRAARVHRQLQGADDADR